MSQKQQITKIVVKANKGIEFHYQGVRDKKKTPFWRKELIGADMDADMSVAFRKLAVAMMKSTAAGEFENVLDKPAVSGLLEGVEIPSFIRKTYSQVVKKVSVKRVDIKYDDGEIKNVKIIGVYTTRAGHAIEMKSPAIQMDLTEYGFESDLLETIHHVLEEGNEFLAGKYVQMEQPEAEEAPDPKIKKLTPEVEVESSGQTRLAIPRALKKATA